MEFVIVFIKNGIFVVAGTLSYVSYTCQQIENLSKSIQNINKKHTAFQGWVFAMAKTIFAGTVEKTGKNRGIN